MDRKTARRYVVAAAEAGLARGGELGQLTDELVGQVAEAVRPVRPGGHGRPWERLEACQAEIAGQVKEGPVGRQDRCPAGTAGHHGALPHAAPVLRGAVRQLGRPRRRSASPTASQVWSARSTSATWACSRTRCTGRQRKVHALIFTAVYSRHMFVWLSFTQTLAALHRGVRGGVGVLRRRVQGPGPGQRLGQIVSGRRRGEPPVHCGLAGLRPALRVRHRRRPGSARRRTNLGFILHLFGSIRGAVLLSWWRR